MAEKEILKAEGFFRKWANFSEPSDSEIDEMELKISNIAAKFVVFSVSLNIQMRRSL